MLSKESSVGWLSLLTSGSTLVCCALPSLLISLGAGATLASLVSTFPQLIWISNHKPLVFGLAAVLLLVSGYFIMQPAACPADRRLAQACARAKRFSRWCFALSVAAFFAGTFFAFVLPAIR